MSDRPTSSKAAVGGAFPTDKQILGYSRWIVFAAAFVAMGIIAPYEYAWSSLETRLGSMYQWSHTQMGLMFTLFVVFESIGMLPGGILRDKFGPRSVTIAGGFVGGLGIFALSLGPSFWTVVILWCIGSFFAGFVYNAAVTTANKWFPDKRGITAGLIAASFSWGALPFIFPLRAIPKTAPDSDFFAIIYLMAAIIGGVSILCAFVMKDPPAGWKPAGWGQNAAAKRAPEHQFTLKEACSTWQMWALIASFILISSAGLAGVSKIVSYSSSFGFGAVAATAAAGGVAIANGLGRVMLATISEKIGRENAMIGSYILSGCFLLLTTVAGALESELLFVAAAMLAIFFWGPLFSLFPAVIGDYYGDVAAGANYGLLYAVAKGSGGVYGGLLSAVLISQWGYGVAMTASAAMAIGAGLIVVPLKSHRPVWRSAITAKIPQMAIADD